MRTCDCKINMFILTTLANRSTRIHITSILLYFIFQFSLQVAFLTSVVPCKQCVAVSAHYVIIMLPCYYSFGKTVQEYLQRCPIKAI